MPELVFARMNPREKAQIVEECKKLGHIVTYLGDGINDTQAMKASDAAIAMGHSP